MKRCPTCGATYRGQPQACPVDGSPLEERPDPLVGRLIGGRFRVTARIGSGGMGTVYRARHEVLERDVAIKVLVPELAGDPTYRTRFLREARAANRIRHEHIIDITDFGESEDGLVYLVMEYLDGMPLMKVVRSGPLCLERAIRIALQVSWALGRAHELDVVHRDIKPDNIYLLRGPRGDDFVKLLDFGLAHVRGDVRLTASGTVFGTPEYMAPEQARGMRATAATDLYALGCVLFEMITGQLPFRGAATTLILQHIREPAPRLSSYVPDAPADLDALLAEMLQKDPEARPANAHGVADRLAALLSGPADVARAPARDDASTPPSPRHSGTRRSIPDGSAGDAWARRLAAVQQAQARAYPGGAPAWLRGALTTLGEQSARVQRLTAERDRCLRRVSELEQALRETQLRMGHAIDTLARDAAQAAAHMRESEAPLLEARRRRAEVEAELRATWAALEPPSAEPPLTREHVVRVGRLGEMAHRWLEADRQVEELERALEPWQRQCDELRFQITQLKGRLGSLGAEHEYEIRQIQEKARLLDEQAQALLQEMAQGADPVIQHLLAFPEVRPLLLAAHEDAAADGA